ncbi:MAG TPA: hypothetical protein VMV33_11275 [Rhodocyclaceae bacterium]|nr:hypothetical protein [Rhodocyclaceae bacterium]
MGPASRGYSKLEFLVAVAVIAILALTALVRLQEIEEISEKTVIDTTLRNIDSGLRQAMAEDIIHGQEGRIALLIGANPVRYLAQPPAGYLGEYQQAPVPVPSGAWFFDSTRRELCYRPKLDRHLVIDGESPLLRWRIEPVGGRLAGGGAGSVRLTAAVGYRWF